ncbi:ABC transporter substrate-binding protein [Brenneria corticis]|uniref:ABC transporter substrate-binding protein n=1 Tax=Brenneria corticis TaxID=2173106 RepID=A0A2U1UD39_9GAMM|nr:ABC transporter substrate-binding protein [Brenneria sp. CFCC 11842]PWC19583.1 ABC transporter substrate-binding protein [Brenneria sp. CFCC 11842]
MSWFNRMSLWGRYTLLVLSLATAHFQAAAATTPQRGGTLTLILSSEPSTLVSLATVAQPAIAVSGKVSEGLLTYDYDLNPLPQLATSWEISPDGKKYTFHLREGVKWHDGQDFTSADVAYSIQLLKKVHPRASSTFANVADIKTPDPLTAVFELSHPAPYLLRAFAAGETPIIPKHLYDKAGADPLKSANNNAPVGTGPYVFSEWVRGSHIVYKRNPHYWDNPKPYIDQLIVKFSPDAVVRSVALETGEADIAYRTPVALSDIKRLKEAGKLGFETKGNNYSYSVAALQFNLDDSYFKDLKVRQAFSHAIDRDALLRVAYFGHGVVTASPIAPGLKTFHDPSPSPYPFDIDAANRLLDEAGYPRGADGVRFRITLDYNTYDDAFRRIADFTRSSLAKIGVGVTLRSADISTHTKRVYTDRDFSLSINMFANLYDPTVGVQRLYWSKNFRIGLPFSNASHYHNPEVDRLLEAAQTENDPATRIAQFKQFQHIVMRDAPDINLLSPLFITIYNPRVHDHSLTADGIEGNLSGVWVEPKR